LRALNRRSVLMAALTAPALALPWRTARAQAEIYPSRPIRVLIPFAAGGGQDEFARRFLPLLGGGIGSRVIIDNRAGGNGVLATEAVARAQSDGYTLLQQTNSFTTNPALMRRLPYDTLKDFRPISLAARTPHVLLVNKDFPANNVAELVAYATSRAERLNYGSAGIGSTNHVAALMFEKATGLSMEHVVYRGAAEFNNDLIAGRIDLVFGGSTQAVALVEAGLVRALGATAASRLDALPGVPTLREAGFDVEIHSWTGYLAPARTPDAIVAKLSAAIQAACADPRIRAQFPTHELVGSTPQQFAAFVQHELEQLAVLLAALRT
jgi:tripartite-type tricarboxylate transporter receptor subunit TctC